MGDPPRVLAAGHTDLDAAAPAPVGELHRSACVVSSTSWVCVANPASAARATAAAHLPLRHSCSHSLSSSLRSAGGGLPSSVLRPDW